MTDTVTQAARLKAADLLAHYADFIRHSVKADEIEAHPYLPEIERVVDDLRAATTAQEVDETERLREALREIDKWCCPVFCTNCADNREIARAALAPEGDAR
jgi:hypothetical protein